MLWWFGRSNNLLLQSQPEAVCSNFCIVQKVCRILPLPLQLRISECTRNLWAKQSRVDPSYWTDNIDDLRLGWWMGILCAGVCSGKDSSGIRTSPVCRRQGRGKRNGYSWPGCQGPGTVLWRLNPKRVEILIVCPNLPLVRRGSLENRANPCCTISIEWLTQMLRWIVSSTPWSGHVGSPCDPNAQVLLNSIQCGGLSPMIT